MTLPGLVWDAWNKAHIKKHHVTVKEAEESYVAYYAVAQTYDKRKIYLGKTKKGRLVIPARKKGDYIYEKISKSQ